MLAERLSLDLSPVLAIYQVIEVIHRLIRATPARWNFDHLSVSGLRSLL
jgi:hypothetical protein